MIKKISITSGVLCIILVATLLFGILPDNSSSNKIIKSGNVLFKNLEYEKALETYLTKEEEEDNDKIHNNIGETAYMKGDYQLAIEHLEKSHGDKLVIGNSYYRLAVSQEDANVKKENLEYALNSYKDGMKEFPEKIEFKYNYEFVKRLLDEINEQQDKEEQEEKQDKEEQNEEGQEKNEDQSQEDQEKQDQEKSDSEEKESQNSEESEKDNGEESKESSDQQETSEENTEESEGVSESDEEIQSLEKINQVLQILQSQEEESLKNNQEVINEGKDEKNDW